jgi:ribonuclease HI
MTENWRRPRDPGDARVFLQVDASCDVRYQLAAVAVVAFPGTRGVAGGIDRTWALTCTTSTEAEVEALLFGMRVAGEHQLWSVTFVTDCHAVLHRVTQGTDDRIQRELAAHPDWLVQQRARGRGVPLAHARAHARLRQERKQDVTVGPVHEPREGTAGRCPACGALPAQEDGSVVYRQVRATGIVTPHPAGGFQVVIRRPDGSSATTQRGTVPQAVDWVRREARGYGVDVEGP